MALPVMITATMSCIAQADAFTWDSTSGDGWSSPDNWLPGLPGFTSSDDIVYATPTTSSWNTNLGTTATSGTTVINSLTFDANVSTAATGTVALHLNSSSDDTGATGSLRLTSINVDPNASSTIVIGPTVATSASGTLAAPSTTLTVSHSGSGLLTINAPMAGSFGLTKNGAGTLVLAGTNTYSGATAVNAGTLRIGNGGVTGTIAAGSGISIAPGATLSVSRSGNATLPNNITGSGTILGAVALTQLELTGSNAFAGTIISNTKIGVNTLNALAGRPNLVVNTSRSFSIGTIYVNGVAATINSLSGAGTVDPVWLGSTSATPRAISVQTGTFAGRFSDGGVRVLGLQKDGGGLLALTGSSSNSGTTRINAGTLQIGVGGTTGALSGSSAITGSAGGTLAFHRTDAVIQGTHFNSVIGGAINVSQIGAGTLTLNGINTYTGTTSVAAGTLALANAGSIASSRSVSVAAGGTFDVTAKSGGYAVPAGQVITGGGTVVGGLIVGGSGAIMASAGSASLATSGGLTFLPAGVLNVQLMNASGTAGIDWGLITADSLTLSGLSVASPFAINLWSLASTNPTVTGTTAGFDAAAPGTWRILTSAASISGFDPSVFTVSTAPTASSGGFTNPLLGGQFSLALSPDTLGLDLVFTPASPFLWYGDGSTAGGSGTWSASSLTWNGGSGVVAWDPSQAAVFGTAGGVVTVSGGQSVGQGITFLTDGYTIAGDQLTLAGSTAAINNLLVTAGTATITSAVTAAAGLSKSGVGLLAIGGDVTAAGGVRVDGGTLTVGTGGTTGSLTGDVAIAAGSTLAFNRSDAPTVAAVISGGGAVRVAGAGLTLTGTNGYTGGTTVASGTLQGDATSLQGVIANDAAVLFNQIASGTYAAAISGAGSLTKAGGGTLVLAGASTYAGATTITGGTLQIGTTGSIAAGSGVSIAPGAVLAVVRSVNSTFANSIAGSGTFIGSGSQIELSGSSSFDGTIIATNKIGVSNVNGLDGRPSVVSNSAFSIGPGFINGKAATINALSGTGVVDPVWTSTAGTRTIGVQTGTFAGTFKDGSGGRVLALTKEGGGILMLTGSSSNSGPTNIDAGTLHVGDGGTTGALSGSSAITGSAGATLAFNRSDTVTQGVHFGTAIGGAVGVVQAGPGLLVLNGTNPYTGTTTVRGGLLRLANAAAASGSRVVPLAGGTVSLSPFLQATVGDLAPNSGGLTDVGNGALSIAGGLSAAELVTALLAGRGDGSWNGTSGITSSVTAAEVAASVPRSVGWIDNGDGSLTTAYAAQGDTNIDWSIDILDASNFLAGGKFDSGTPAVWLEGDFSYDGVVDILDAADFFATALYDAGNYNTPPGSADIAAVPEPMMCGLMPACMAGLAAFRLLRRRRATPS